MVKIKLREDDWFEVGKKHDPTVPLASVIYPHKQELKERLLAINASTMGDLEKALSGIPDIKFFEGKPYLKENKIYILRDDGMGDAYLGEAVK